MIRCSQCRNLFPQINEQIRCPHCGHTIPREDGITRFTDQNSGEFHFPKDRYDTLNQKEVDHFWFKSRARIILSCIRKYLPDREHATMCEVGCGTGLLAQQLSREGYQVSCCDLHTEGLRYAQKRNAGENYYSCNIYEFPFEEEYDAILACDVIEHLEDDTKALVKISTALKPGGICLITVPAGRRLWSEKDIRAGHKRRYGADSLHEVIRSCGLVPIRLSFFMSIILPVLWVKRKMFSLLSHHPPGQTQRNDGIDELDIPQFFNRIFYYLLLPERLIIPYWNIPFGTSLICIAEKPGRRLSSEEN